MPLGHRIAAVSPRVRDGVLAAAFLAVGLSEVAFGFRDGGLGPPLSGPPAAEVAVVAALTLPVAWRRWHPLPALMVVAAAMAAQVLFLSPSAPFLVGLVPLLLLTFEAGQGRAEDAAWAFAVSAGALALTTLEVPDLQAAGEVTFDLVVLVGVCLAARYAGRRQRRVEQLGTYAAQLESDQDRRGREAIAAERARIARELHDIVAHSVSVMGIQAGGARAALDTDPERTRQALQLIEATAREAIGDLRRLLGILRTDDDPSALTPQPGLGELDHLLGQVREAGLDVEVHVVGSPIPLSPGVDLAAYRIVQEALTNVVKHAGPTTVEVLVHYNGDTIKLRVTDAGSSRAASEDPATVGGGHGLVGMRERAAVYGGSLDAGPMPGRGFQVHAVLPTRPEQ